MKQALLFISTSLFILTSIACPLSKQFNLAEKQHSSTLFRTLPKGAELHTHLDGAVYAEKLIAAHTEGKNFCLDPHTFTVTPATSCPQKMTLSELSHDPHLYTQTIEEWSMKNFDYQHTDEKSYDHFFDTFEKFILLSWAHRQSTMMDVLERAAQNHVLYLELMDTIDNNASGLLGNKIDYSPNFKKMQLELIQHKLFDLTEESSHSLQALKENLNERMHCFNPLLREKACGVHYKFLYQVLREQKPNQVFASLLFGFELAQHNPDVVGINLVQAEHGPIALRDYKLHMQMIQFLHKQYPKIHVSLHAGELIPGLVPLADLNFHIQDAIRVAGADRIGHGVAIQHEKNLPQLLSTMKNKNTLVEINLSSNEAILGLKADNHPLNFYLQHQIPVALSTDDEGVLRTNISREYKKAYDEHHLDYCALKQISRNSLTYSFLPGKSIWNQTNPKKLSAGCTLRELTIIPPSKTCLAFLKHSEKARLQWQLEKALLRYEKNYRLIDKP